MQSLRLADDTFEGTCQDGNCSGREQSKMFQILPKQLNEDPPEAGHSS